MAGKKSTKSNPWWDFSARTPFFRRFFVNERKRDTKELQKLYKRVKKLHAESGIDPQQILLEIIDKIEYPLSRADETGKCLCALLSQCGELYPPFEPDWNLLSIEIAADVRNMLYTQEACLLGNHIPKIMDALVESLKATLVPVGKSLFTAPLYTFDPKMVKNVMRPFYSDDVLDNYLFGDLRHQFQLNMTRVTGSEDKVPTEFVIDFLKDTPFEELLHTPYPIDIPDDTFFSHIWCLAGTGGGKTTFLTQLMLHHFKSDATVILVDSQGDMIPKLRTLESIQDRLVNVDPTNPPRIDLFKNATIETIMYLCSMLGTDMSGKQTIFFKMMAHLLMRVPNATLLDFLKIMDDLTPYEQYVEQLSEIQKDFFKKDFMSKNFGQTREQVKYRLQGILENQTIEKLFVGSGHMLDLGDKMDNGSVILIDTNRDYLKSASPYFGRIFIACILQEVYARANKKRHPTYLIIDECQEYMDSNIDEFLTQARKYKCGLVLAHQNLDQATRELQASLSSNTAIKMVTGVSTADARKLAPDMRTDHEYILSLPRLTFATYIRNITPTAIPFTVIPGLLDQEEHVELTNILNELESEEVTPEEPQEMTPEEPQEVPAEHEKTSSQDAPYDNIDTSASENW